MAILYESDLWCIASFIGNGRDYLALAATCRYIHRALVETEYRHVHKHLTFFPDDGYTLPLGCKTVNVHRAREVLDDQNIFVCGETLSNDDYHSYCFKKCSFMLSYLETTIDSCVAYRIGIKNMNVLPCSVKITNSIIRRIDAVDRNIGIDISGSAIGVDDINKLLDARRLMVENCTSLDGSITINGNPDREITFTARTMTVSQIDDICKLDLCCCRIVIDAEHDPVTANYLMSLGAKCYGFVCEYKKTRLGRLIKDFEPISFGTLMRLNRGP